MRNKPSRPIKVMHIIARMNVGGPAVEITELMRGLDTNVISQRLVTGYCDDDEADFLETQAPDIFATRINGLGRSIRPTDDARVLGTLIRVIRASRPDIVHTHTGKAGILGRVAARASGTGPKVFHTYHGHLLNGYFGPSQTKFVTEIERQLARSTDRIITVGDKVRDDLLGAGIGHPDQHTVIRAGVRLGPLPTKHKARRELGLPDGPVIVLMLGRLARIKRPDRFAEIVDVTKRRGLNVHYLVAGGGEQEQWLRDRVERDDLPVTLLGWRADLERIIAATDVALLTSDSEGIPISLVQTSLAGVPAVATHVGSVNEIVIHHETGLLCQPDVVELADGLSLLATIPSYRATLGVRAQQVAESRFSPAAFISHHTAEYAPVSPGDPTKVLQ